MILTLAAVCFMVGFGAAVICLSLQGIVNTHQSKTKNWLQSLIIALNQLFNRKLLPEILPLSGPSFENSINSKDDSLLTKEQIETQFESSSWQALAYGDFKSVILAKEKGMKTFPCIYATMGYRADDHRYLFLRSDDPSEPRNVRLIGPALRQYLETSHSLGSNTSLVIFCAPSQRQKSVEEYNNTFWDMLRGLRMTDSKSWPGDVPESVDSEKWTFCYDGQPIFPVMLTPGHMRRWSRHMTVPIIALQPKWVLDKLLSTPEIRESATGKVRKLLKEYDQIDVSPDLTSYGQPGTSEARQLCLMDENNTVHCPYQNFDS